MDLWEIITVYCEKYTKHIKQGLDKMQTIFTLNIMEDIVNTGI
jgi:hypothetical protein